MKNINAFLQNDPFHIHKLPSKWKDKHIIVEQAALHLYTKQPLTEKEITQQLSKIYDDPVELRRYLIDFGFMQRTKDGSTYWFTSSTSTVVTIRLF